MTIELSDVGKKYGKLWIFKGITATFESNHIYGLIGFNGSGKSTLLQLISGYTTANQGQVSFRESEKEIDVDQRYQKLAIAAPYLDLFDEFSVRETIALHAKFKPLAHGVSHSDLLEEIDLAKHQDKLLNQLSSGMRQRLKLALAIYSKTPVLLLDEPSANLDSRWSDWFNESLSNQSKNRLVIICTNSQESEMRCINSAILNVSDYQH
ncbi:MAG: ABC transporter ATP-binding protein [Salibacteraceae bacterium]|jgi:ABC-type multidrug transport system ATPase subunit|nr:ABC transporter ATP-binding protein [Salibacteraceae bacterium]MDP4687608.1 ABC transporter ATP-binding protein [Salibacteraceae bacterium]MDP4762883.1 ABC transporter ATP-binding protein [Salibacteraceae bacterium]MDP4934646.1 ABC transporter ATP-binding protein [Salibacteraceae bacterium]MDP4963547.1 ABC transporter ATP-binding protein [Salibacteraceae bacterium]